MRFVFFLSIIWNVSPPLEFWKKPISKTAHGASLRDLWCFVHFNKIKHSDSIHLIPKAWSEHGVEALWTGQKNILLSCPQCLDSMLAPGFWNKVYQAKIDHITIFTSSLDSIVRITVVDSSILLSLHWIWMFFGVLKSIQRGQSWYAHALNVKWICLNIGN